MQDNDFFKMKSDQGKIDWSLLPWRAIESAARIMTIAIAPKEQGGKGYGLASWQDVPEGFYRYWAAMIRHIVRRFVYDEVIDQESGEPHMGHVICNAAFVFSKDLDHDNFKENSEIKPFFDKNFYCRQNKEQQPTQVQLPHDIDYKEIFKQCNDTYESAIRRTCELAKPSTQEKEIYCLRCGVLLKNYLIDYEETTEQMRCFHQWDIKNKE